MIQFTTTYCALHRVTQVQQHLPGVLGWRRGRALHTHLQFATGQTHRDRSNPHAPADHPDWQVDFRGLLTRNPTQVRWDSAPRPHLSLLWGGGASTTSPHSPRQQRKSANRFSYLGWCVCWGSGTMAAAAGRGGRPATGRCSGTGRLQTQRDVWTHEPDDNIILDAFLTQRHSCIQSFFIDTHTQ